MRRLAAVAVVAVVSALLLVTTVLPAAAQDRQWTRQFGTPNSDCADGVYTDGDYSYVVGFMTVQSPGSGIFTRDAFVTKFDYDGEVEWSRQFGWSFSWSDDYAKAVTGDDSGIYVVGYGGGDAYIRKYSTDGVELWTRQFGTYSSDVAWAVSVDETGVYVAGYTDGSFTGWVNSGGSDVFVAKFGLDGGPVWVTQLGSSSSEYAVGVAADGVGGVAVAGHTWGNLDGTSKGQADAFLSRLDTAGGTVLWTRQVGTPAWDAAEAVAADGNGIYVGGETLGKLGWSPNAGGMDGFVMRYNAAGKQKWVRVIQSPANDTVRGIALWDGGLYAAGSTEGSLTWRGSSGASDMFVRRYDKDGSRDWTWQHGGPGWDMAYAVSASRWLVVLAGLTEGQLPHQTQLGSGDAFAVSLED